MNILYVENHQRFAEIVLQTFLNEHNIIVVPGLADARQKLAQFSFDLILVDYDLDDGKGVELVSEQKAQGTGLPIIAVSSHEEGNRALLAAGADRVCAKRDFKRIAGMIDEVIAEKLLGGSHRSR